MYSSNLKKLREELGWSVNKLAKETDIPASTLWGYEGAKRVPSVEFPIQLYRKLNIIRDGIKCKLNITWFLTGDGEMFIKEKKDFTGIEFTVEEAQQITQRLNNFELRLKSLEENKELD